MRAQKLAQLQQQDVDEVIADLLDGALSHSEEHLSDGTQPDPVVEREFQAYLAMHPILKEQYLDQYVAIHGGNLVDHDQDYAALYARVDAAYPNDFVWMAEVKEEPLPTIYHRSPRLIR